MKNYKKIALVYLVLNLMTIFNLHSQEVISEKNKIDWRKYLKQNQLLEYIDKSPRIIKSNTKSLPFKKLNYNKVIAYDYEGNEEAFGSIISKEGKFVPVVLKQKSLDKNQVEQIIRTLVDKKTYGEASAACFNPHMALVFYNDKKIVFKIDICFGCNYLISSGEIPAMNHKKIKFEDGHFYYAIGFTKRGKENIKVLAKQLGFLYGK